VTTHNLPSQTSLQTNGESGSALLSSAFEDGVISLLTTGFDMLREPLPELTNSGDSASVIERCRQQLAPVLFLSAKSRDPSTDLDIKGCAAMLTDDHCCEFLQQARDMKLQMDALDPHRYSRRVIAVDEQIREVNTKRDRDRDEDDQHGPTWTTRVRRGSGDDTISVVSRKDSEATLVDSPIDYKASTSKQDSFQDISLPNKQIMERDETSSPNDRRSADVQTSAGPHQIAVLPPTPVVNVENIEMITCHSPDSRPTQTAEAQNITTFSSPEPRVSSSLVTMEILSTPGAWLKRQGLTRPGILDIEFIVEERTIPTTPPSRYARFHGLTISLSL
jgi:hypothetical protein